MRSKSFIPACAAAALLAGCQPGEVNSLPYMGGADNFGEANRQTMAAQVIDPNPTYLEPVPETHAEHAGQAVERYRMDRVKQPDRVKTNNAELAEKAREQK